jgi:ABC-type glutathione transport system ATPase component
MRIEPEAAGPLTPHRKHPPRCSGRIVGGEIRFEGRDLLKLDAAAMRAVRGKIGSR